MAKDQVEATLADLRQRVERLEVNAARTEVVTQRVMEEIVPGVNTLTDAVARLYTKVSVQGIKLYVIVAIISSGCAILASALIQKVL